MEQDVKKLKALLGLTEEQEQEPALLFIMDNVREMILNYCSLEELPEGLNNTAYRMAVDLYRAEAIGEKEAALTVASVSEGDTGTSFGSSSDQIRGTILKNYQEQLNRYRRMVW